jgi:hypothetical protein
VNFLERKVGKRNLYKETKQAKRALESRILNFADGTKEKRAAEIGILACKFQLFWLEQLSELAGLHPEDV